MSVMTAPLVERLRAKVQRMDALLDRVSESGGSVSRLDIVDAEDARDCLAVISAAKAYIDNHVALTGELRCDAEGGLKLMRALDYVEGERP